MRRCVAVALALSVAVSCDPRPPEVTESRSAAHPREGQAGPQRNAIASVTPPITALVATRAAAPVVATPDASTAPSGSPSTDAPAEMYRGQSVAVWLDALAHRPVVRMLHRFSSTTAVYHLDLGDGIEAAFKPETRVFRTLWHNDIAGYRLARALGVADRSPPATARRVALEIFGRHAARDGLMPSRENPAEVWGAVILWLPTLGHTDLHTDAGRARWNAWLDVHGRIPRAHTEQAEQISTLLLFDYLQGNEDRWNAGNLRTDEHGDVLYRDNNGGWWSAIMSDPATGEWRLHDAQRFRRSVVDALVRTDIAALRAEFARDSAAPAPLVNDRVLAAYGRRRARALAYVRACVRRFGEGRVFAWP